MTTGGVTGVPGGAGLTVATGGSVAPATGGVTDAFEGAGEGAGAGAGATGGAATVGGTTAAGAGAGGVAWEVGVVGTMTTTGGVTGIGGTGGGGLTEMIRSIGSGGTGGGGLYATSGADCAEAVTGRAAGIQMKAAASRAALDAYVVLIGVLGVSWNWN